MRKTLLGGGFGIFIIIVWQIIALVIDMKFILPAPTDVVMALWDYRMELVENTGYTLNTFFTGFIIAIVIGVILAIGMDASKGIKNAVYPLITITQTVPVICIAPVFVLWFGFSSITRVLVVILGTFFTITVNVYDGFQKVNTNMLEMLQTFGASKIQIFLKLKLKFAVPNFLSALKIAIPYSVLCAVMSEWLGAPGGLGVFCQNMQQAFKAAALFAPIVVLAVFTLLFTSIVGYMEKRFTSWQKYM